MERELRKEEWRTFFDEFSRKHVQSLVTVDCDRVGCAFQDMSLRKIVAGDGVVEIFVVAPNGEQTMHVVRKPSRVFAGDTGFTIVNTEGKKTALRETQP